MEIVINNYGASLTCDNDGFVVSNQDGRQRISSNGITSILVSKGANISSNAILLAVEKEIEILFIDRSGKPAGRIWSPKYGSISTIRKGQIGFVASKSAVDWIKGVIIRKIENQQAILLMLDNNEDSVKRNQRVTAQNRLEAYIEKIKALDGDRVYDIASTLRGWEGVASKIYFETANLFLPSGYQFEGRSQHPAKDIANMVLNYGYGMLYGRIEGCLIRAGVDPYIGVLHRDEYNRPILVYDVIEQYRIWIDYVVMSLLTQSVMTDEHYSVKSDGSYWLEPLGRRIIIQGVNDYLEETIEVGAVVRSRSTQLYLYCQNLAQEFKKYN